ncbi:heavy metal translocating P-type ATPase [Polynucleobacter sp. IMCC30063]|uniref:heavy metal translocating P-type ATPase n=1 Tax=Polynucleobacter sp. IMCC30063 TaxID=2907298 RepID=UPI001F438008|nr:heavy metal translocating P-type ATPase [Polynucleobacter sp. IMCC30063]MCE7506284.1 heavy metal translocating P-type ATPase [Polynucleobacter sp. IMCC30063]
MKNATAGVESAREQMAAVHNCYHCGSLIPAATYFVAELGGLKQVFCCAGCMAIAQTIHGKGLDVFYARRIQLGVKPDQALSGNTIPNRLLAYDDPTLLARFSRPIADGLLETTLRLEKIRCAACVWLCDQYLKRLPGVRDVQINYVTQKAKLQFDLEQCNLSHLLFEIERIGYSAWPFEPSQTADLGRRERRQLLTRLGVALLGMMQVMMYAWPTYTGTGDLSQEYGALLGWASWVLTVPVILYSAGPIFLAAWRSVRLFPQTHILGMDVPIAIALGLAFFAGTLNLLTGNGASYFDSITMFVAFILSARYVELLARQDAQSGAEALAKQLPAICEKYLHYPDSLELKEVPVVNCHQGDFIRVSPGEIIPADGVLIANETEINESLLTGEARAIRKKIGDPLYAGSHNILNPCIMRIDTVGQATRIAGIAALLDQALLAKPHLVSLAERWASHFILFLLATALIASGLWFIFDPSKSWTVLVAVLVASCPCALSLAVPTAMAAAQGAVTKLGILIVRGHVMESLVEVSDLVIDKTGTLTLGQPELQTIRVARADFSAHRALSLAAAMEAGQTHPLALSLLRAAAVENLPVQNLPLASVGELGRGLRAGEYRLGSALHVGLDQQIEADLLERQSGEHGKVYLVDGQGLIATFLFLDTPRPGVQELLSAVQQRKITVHLVSGDDAQTVAWWANYFGITNFSSAASPEGKYAYVAKLQEQGKIVWAIGDGVNDAPLLARANVSVAVGAGAPLITAGADAILTANSLEPLVYLLRSAIKTRLIIKENIAWALLYNVVAIPVAMLGWVNPWVAGIGMSLSSLFVTLNAWRLRKT